MLGCALTTAAVNAAPSVAMDPAQRDSRCLVAIEAERAGAGLFRARPQSRPRPRAGGTADHLGGRSHQAEHQPAGDRGNVPGAVPGAEAAG
jgi:hypothetical protein